MRPHHLTILFVALLLQTLSIAQPSWTRITPLPQENHIHSLIRIPGTERMITAGSGSTVMYSDDAGDSWELVLNPAGLGNNFSCERIYFIDDSTGFIAGSNYTILKTTNLGIEWSIVHTEPSNHSLSDIYFLSHDTGFAVGENGMLLKTTDSGKTWQQVQLNTQGYFNRIVFADELSGFIITYSNTEWIKTTDGGETWASEVFPPSLLQRYIHDMIFVNDSTGFVFQNNGSSSNLKGFIFRTTDGGQTWMQVFEDFSSYDCRFAINESQHIAALCGSWQYQSKALISDDGGENWNSSFLPDGSWFAKTICFYNDLELVAAGGRGYMYASNDAGLNWQQTDTHQFRGHIRDVQFLDAQQGYALYETWDGGVAQTLLKHTSDGGTTWQDIFSPYFHQGALSFLNPQTGYILGTSLGSVLLRTTDGGLNWEEIQLAGLNLDNPRLSFFDLDNGIISGSSTVFKTSDGGMNWEDVTPAGMWVEINGIEYRSVEVVYMCGTANFSNAHVFISVDGGTSWETIETGEVGAARHLRFVGEQTVFLACFSAILKSIDGGYSWQPTNLHTGDVVDFQYIHFPTSQTGYAMCHGSAETIFKTTDGGENWYPLDIPATSGLNFAYFSDDLKGIVFGNNGLVMSTETGGVIGINDPVQLVEDWFSVGPNPFTDDIIFRFHQDIPVQGCKLQIIDMFGRVVHQLVLRAGTRQFTYSVAGLPPGIYIIRVLLSEGGSKSVKLIKH